MSLTVMPAVTRSKPVSLSALMTPLVTLVMLMMLVTLTPLVGGYNVDVQNVAVYRGPGGHHVRLQCQRLHRPRQQPGECSSCQVRSVQVSSG